MADDRQTTLLPHRFVRREMPGARGLDLTVTRYGRPDAALFWVSPNEWVAWILRKLSDRLDGSVSYAYRGTMPAECTREDWRDAVEFGATATARYLVDLAEERRHG